MKTKENVISDALESALYLLNNEIQSVESDSVREEYSNVIEKLSAAIEATQK